MSNIEKTADAARVRFRDGDDLVEFEGSSRDSKKLTATVDTAAKSPTKGKVRKSGKKDADKTTLGTSSASEVETDKDSYSGAVSTKRDRSSIDTEKRPNKPPQPPPPPPPPPKPTINVDEEKGVDGPRSSLEERSEDLKLKYYSAFQTINRIHGGAIMKIKTGVTGITPAKDSFPMFGSVKKFTCFHWDADSLPADWCIAYYSDTPDWFTKSLAAVGEGLSSTEYAAQIVSTGPSLVESSLFPLPALDKAQRTIPLHSISEIVVDSGNGGFRLYCGKEVVHFTPLSGYNPLARRPACWADAVYSALSLVTEPDPELVQLHKQEFVDVLAQHSPSEARAAESPAKSVSTNSSSPTNRKPRPGLMRRRSTLSNFFGVGASKPLQESLDEQDTLNNGTHPDHDHDHSNDSTQPNKNTSARTAPAPVDSPRRKMSLSFAVKMVRGAMKRSVSAPSATFREATDELAAANLSGTNKSDSGEREAELSYDSVYARNSINFFNNDSVQKSSTAQDSNSAQVSSGANRGYNSGNDSGSDRINLSRQNSTSSFLSQSLLSNLMNTGRSSAIAEPASNKAPVTNSSVTTPSVAIEEKAAADALQAQINALLEQNRALQQQLADKVLEQSVGTGAVITAANAATNTTYTSDTDNSQSSVTAPAAAKVYTTDELSTLRAFTARNNFHQNKSAVKNTSRAFGTTATTTTTGTTSNTKYPFQSIAHRTNHNNNHVVLSAQHIHEHYGPNSKRPVSPATHVLGKQTVLDLLLAQSPVNHTISIGDDYYNDTIELEPQHLTQLIELQKLQREHARRAESTDTTNVITTNHVTNMASTIRALTLDENDCAVPRADSTHVSNTVPTPMLSKTRHEIDYTSGDLNDLPIQKHNVRGLVRDSTSDHRKSASVGADLKALVEHALTSTPVTTVSVDADRSASSKVRTPLGSGIHSTTKTTAKSRPVVEYITSTANHAASAADTQSTPHATPHAILPVASHTVSHSIPAAVSSSSPKRPQQRGVPLGHQLSQHTAPNSAASSVTQPTKQMMKSTEAQREQKLHTFLSAPTSTPRQPSDYLLSSDDELQSDTSKHNVNNRSSPSRDNDNTHVINSPKSTVAPVDFIATATVAVPQAAYASSNVRTNAAKKGFLARLSQNNNSKVSKVGNNILSVAQGYHNQNNTQQQQPQQQQKERSYSADLSNLSGSERASNITSRTNGVNHSDVLNRNSSTLVDADVADEHDPFHNIRPPLWSNSYYYHSPNNSTKSAPAARVPNKSKKSRSTPDRGSKSPNNDTESITHILPAVSVDGNILCTLLNRAQLTTHVSTRGDVSYWSDTGIVLLHSTKLKSNKLDTNFLLLETPLDTLLVPLSGVAAAELDTNNTGLFKISFTLPTVNPLQHKNNFPVGGIIHRLIAQYNKQTHTTSVVLKAEDILSLVDWLTVLLDLKYIPTTV